MKTARYAIAAVVPVARGTVPRFPRAILAAGLIAAAAPAAAQTKLEGEYQFQMESRKPDRLYPWAFDSNNNDIFNMVQLRLFSVPAPGVETFVKAEAEWNSGGNGNRRPQLQFRDAHLRFRREFGRRGVDAYLFSRQNRYWVENHLIPLIWDGQAGDNGNGQGLRLDTWGFGGLRTAFIVSDFSGGGNQDAWIARVWRPFFTDNLRLGATYDRKTESTPAATDKDPLRFTEVRAADMRLTLRNVDYRLEIAQGHENLLDGRVRRGEVPREALDWRLDKFSLADPQAAFPDDIVLKGEARSFRFGSPRFGYFNFAPGFYLMGPQFRNYLGDSGNDTKGLYVNSWYLLPARAVTLSTNYGRWENEYFQKRKGWNLEEELLVEFAHGFTTKLRYRASRTEDFNTATQETQLTKNDDVFTELVVENTLAWLRVQGLVKDVDTVFQKEIMAIETSINVSRTVKVYNRFAFANDPVGQRKAMFSELQYRPTGSVELFLAFGPDWIGGGSNPVYEGNLVSGQDHKDLLRLRLRGNF
jgi:hypothetical protein